MGFDRSKFQAAKKENLKKQQEEADSMRPKGGNSTRPDYVSLVEGDNIVRIFPPHPGASSYIYQKSIHWLPFKNDDGEEKNRPIFNSKIHSSIKDHDIIGKYIELAKKAIEGEETDAEKIKERINNLYHWKHGISASYKWVCYAEVTNSKGTAFGRLELSNAVKNQLDKLAFSEDDVDDAMEVDPFTDPDDGLGVKVTYRLKDENGQKVKPQDVYTVTFNTKKFVPVKMPLSDAQLEAFSEMDSLEKMLVDVYTQRDIDKALESLQIYDDKNSLGVISTSDFLDFIEEVYSLYPEPQTEVQKENAKGGEVDLPFGNPKDDTPEDDLPWKDEELPEATKSMVDNNSTIDSPSTRMSDDDKAKKLADLKARLKK